MLLIFYEKIQFKFFKGAKPFLMFAQVKFLLLPCELKKVDELITKIFVTFLMRGNNVRE